MIEFLIVAAYLLVGYFVFGVIKEEQRTLATIILVPLFWPFVLACAAGIIYRDWASK